jgi:hypothetical protein
LETLIPANARAVIVAERREDESDPMTDYYGYRTLRTVILGFSAHTRDLFPELRNYAADFPETVHLSEENRSYERREKYTGGEGYYLGENRYGGWIVRKTKYYKDRKSMIEAFSLIAGDEANICVKAPASATAIPETLTGNFMIVDYSEKALAVFGDTKAVKDRLKALGGRFNPQLTHQGVKQAGWIFSKKREEQLRNTLNGSTSHRESHA